MVSAASEFPSGDLLEKQEVSDLDLIDGCFAEHGAFVEHHLHERAALPADMQLAAMWRCLEELSNRIAAAENAVSAQQVRHWLEERRMREVSPSAREPRSRWSNSGKRCRSVEPFSSILDRGQSGAGRGFDFSPSRVQRFENELGDMSEIRSRLLRIRTALASEGGDCGSHRRICADSCSPVTTPATSVPSSFSPSLSLGSATPSSCNSAARSPLRNVVLPAAAVQLPMGRGRKDSRCRAPKLPVRKVSKAQGADDASYLDNRDDIIAAETISGSTSCSASGCDKSVDEQRGKLGGEGGKSGGAALSPSPWGTPNYTWWVPFEDATVSKPERLPTPRHVRRFGESYAELLAELRELRKLHKSASSSAELWNCAELLKRSSDQLLRA